MVAFGTILLLVAITISWSTVDLVCNGSTVDGNTADSQESHTGILYGGILKLKPDVLVNDSSEALKIVKTTLEVARQNGLVGAMPPEGQFAMVASDITKKKLVVTSNGQTPAQYIYEGRGKDGRIHRFRRQVIFGVLYSFTLTWSVGTLSENGAEQPSSLPALQHYFTVSRDLRKKLYVYEHRVECKAQSQVSESCSADGSCHQEEGSSMMVEDARLSRAATTSSSLPLWKQCSAVGTMSSSYHSSRAVTVLSYNIWNFNSADVYGDDYARRVRRIGKLCRKSGAGIIAFQEVRFDFNRGGKFGHSQVDHLSSELSGFQYVFQAAMTYPEGIHGRVEEGPAIFSAFPIVSSDYILLPRDLSDEGDVHQRILLHAEILTPQLGPVHVFVTHLSLSAVARNRSVVEMWKFMKHFDGLLIIAGDLNAEPHSPAMQYLAGLAEIDGSWTSNLKDAWTVFHKEPRPAAPDVYGDFEAHDPGLTFSTLEDDLVKRIDYLFYRAPETVQHTSTSLVDDGGRWDDATSDHIGVKAEFEPGAN